MWEGRNQFDPRFVVEVPLVDKVEVLDAEPKARFRACENQLKTCNLSRIRRHRRSDCENEEATRLAIQCHNT